MELLSSGASDWVSLDEVIWVVTEGDLSPQAKEQTIRILGLLYQEELMVPGDLGHTGFEDWTGSSDEWLMRSRSELDRWEWRPMGAGFWLRLTDRGRAHVGQDASTDR